MIFKATAKSKLSKLKFFVGRNPRIIKTENWRKYIPEPYETVITFSADFELAWAPRYSKRFHQARDEALFLARRERKNVPKILKRCGEFNIPVTWATVGHLFLDSCNEINGVKHPDIVQLSNFENKYWKFDSDDWFEYDPCTNIQSAPEWYAPDLIDLILNSKIKHEIGCHTFSHIDCRDKVCSDEVFISELNKCKQLAADKGLALKSFVHPGHTIGNLDNLAALGFDSFQSDPGNILAYPIRHQNKLWELQRSYELDLRNDWSIKYHIYRYKKIVDRAIKSNTICNFWFHPSFSENFLNHILPHLFEHINNNREKILITTVGDYIDWLNQTMND